MPIINKIIPVEWNINICETKNGNWSLVYKERFDKRLTKGAFDNTVKAMESMFKSSNLSFKIKSDFKSKTFKLEFINVPLGIISNMMVNEFIVASELGNINLSDMLILMGLGAAKSREIGILPGG